MVNPSTDVFSLGVVLYELLTLQRPFGGDTVPEILHEISFKDPPRLRGVNPAIPRDLETICQKAIEKAPDDRYHSAGHVAADLRCLIAGNPIMARPPGLVRKARRAARKQRHLIASGLIAVAGVLVGVFAYGRLTDDDPWLTVLADEPDAVVYLRRIDLRSNTVGPKERLGQAPINKVRVAPGYYRIVIVVEGHGYSEMTRYLAVDGAETVRAKIPPTEEVVSEMQWIGRAPGAPTSSATSADYQTRIRPLEAFWIDRVEVSNADYKAFLDDSGHAWPVFWGGAYPSQWADLPVVGITTPFSLASR